MTNFNPGISQETPSPIWHSGNPQMQGYWFAVEPTPAAWNTIQKVQHFVGAELAKEKIKSWASYPHPISHVSLFLGLNEQTTAQEKTTLMRRVADKVAGMKKFMIDFDLSQATLERGPGNYMTLHFQSPAVQALNVKIREAITEAIAAGEFDRSHLYTNGTGKDKLELDIKPHMTVGILDVEESPSIPWDEKHKDVKAFVNKEKTAAFEKLFVQEATTGSLRNLRVSFPVKGIDLLGTNTLKGPNGEYVHVPQKKYVNLATCELDPVKKPAAAPQKISAAASVFMPKIQQTPHIPARPTPPAPLFTPPQMNPPGPAPQKISPAAASALALKFQIENTRPRPTPPATQPPIIPAYSAPLYTPPPMNPVDRVINQIKYGLQGQYYLHHGVDHKGDLMVEVRFDLQSDAQFLLHQVKAGQPNATVHFVDGKYIVKLGKKRFQTLFGQEGEALHAQAVSFLMEFEQQQKAEREAALVQGIAAMRIGSKVKDPNKDSKKVKNPSKVNVHKVKVTKKNRK